MQERDKRFDLFDLRIIPPKGVAFDEKYFVSNNSTRTGFYARFLLPQFFWGSLTFTPKIKPPGFIFGVLHFKF